jgi:hypothetical protein
MDPQEMIDRMIEIVPADTGKFRNVVPQKIEDMLKQHQLQAWRTGSRPTSVSPPRKRSAWLPNSQPILGLQPYATRVG